MNPTTLALLETIVGCGLVLSFEPKTPDDDLHFGALAPRGVLVAPGPAHFFRSWILPATLLALSLTWIAMTFRMWWLIAVAGVLQGSAAAWAWTSERLNARQVTPRPGKAGAGDVGPKAAATPMLLLLAVSFSEFPVRTLVGGALYGTLLTSALTQGISGTWHVSTIGPAALLIILMNWLTTPGPSKRRDAPTSPATLSAGLGLLLLALLSFGLAAFWPGSAILRQLSAEAIESAAIAFAFCWFQLRRRRNLGYGEGSRVAALAYSSPDERATIVPSPSNRLVRGLLAIAAGLLAVVLLAEGVAVR
jgi:hypothetical protein